MTKSQDKISTEHNCSEFRTILIFTPRILFSFFTSLLQSRKSFSTRNDRMKRLIYIVLCLTTVTNIVPPSNGKPVVPKPLILSGLSLNWPCQSTKNIYETSGRYITRNVIATRAQIYEDQAILALPRYKPGVPFTLGVLSMKSQSCEPKVAPFPCWAIQEEGNCQALQSAVDIVLDVQDILWVLDVGIVNTLEQPVRRCPPKVVGVNAKSGKVSGSLIVDLGQRLCESRISLLRSSGDKIPDYCEILWTWSLGLNIHLLESRIVVDDRIVPNE